MPHLDEGTIHAWLDGALPPDEAQAVEAHVAECAECAAGVAEARGLIAASSRILSSLDAVPGGVIPMPVASPERPALLAPSPASRWGRARPWRGYVVRAAAVLLVAVGVRAAFRTDARLAGVPDPHSTAGADSAPPPASDATAASGQVAAEAAVVAPAPVTAKDGGATKRGPARAGAVGTAGGAKKTEADVAVGAGAPAPASREAPALARADVATLTAKASAGAMAGAAMNSARVSAPSSADEAKERMSASAPDAPPLRLVQGWTMVTTRVETTASGAARRTIYEVRPTVRVELEERMSTLTLTDAVAQSEAQQAFSVRSQARRTRGAATMSAPQAAPAAPPREERESASAPAVRWTSVTGTELILRGPISTAELETLRARIEVPRR